MDKNNDIQVIKISKWADAPISIKNMRNYILESWKNYAAPPCCPPLDPSCQDSICESMMTLLESVLDDYNELEARHQESCGMISQYEEENRILRDQRKKLTAKLTESEFDLLELKKKYEFQKEKNMELASKNRALGMEISERCKQIHELKDTLEKDRKLAKLVGENVVECIKYGAEHGYYEVHPLNRFDIHIEETHVGSIQDRHAIPKIVVRCNNVQTEMERDTAEHECEELNKKVDTVWRANDELNRKIKALEKEKIDLEEKLKESGESSMVEIIRLKDRCTELAINRLEKEYEKLKVENNNLTTGNKRLNDAVDAWRKENKKLKEMVRSLRRTVDILNGEG